MAVGQQEDRSRPAIHASAAKSLTDTAEIPQTVDSGPSPAMTVETLLTVNANAAPYNAGVNNYTVLCSDFEVTVATTQQFLNPTDQDGAYIG